MVAEHEAGHAKALHLHGGRISGVRIGPGVSKWGYTAGKSLRNPTKMADVSLAGPYAEALHTGVSTNCALCRGEGMSGSDWDHFQSETGGGKAAVRFHERRLAKMISKNDPGIKALADELVAKGKVSGARAHQILRNAK